MNGKLDVERKIKLNVKTAVPPNSIDEHGDFEFPWTSFGTEDPFEKIEVTDGNGDNYFRIALKGKNSGVYIDTSGSVYAHDYLSEEEVKEIQKLIPEIPNMWKEGLALIKKQDAMLKEIMDLLPDWEISVPGYYRREWFFQTKRNLERSFIKDLILNIYKMKARYKKAGERFPVTIKCRLDEIEKTLRYDWDETETAKKEKAEKERKEKDEKEKNDIIWEKKHKKWVEETTSLLKKAGLI